jgi:hypothetical protein
MKEAKKSALNDAKRKVFQVDKSSLETKKVYLKQLKLPFTVICSSSSVELYSDAWNVRTRSKFFLPENMNFIKKVRKYAIDNYVAMKYRNVAYRLENIDYFEINKEVKEGDVFESVYCLDINGAYWQTALLMGIISKEIYTEGLKKDKVTRLASLGSLAKRKEVFRYNGVSYDHIETIRDNETENLWFAICKRVADIMQELKKLVGDDFIFYWVDGIYFKKSEETVKKVQEYLDSCTYECKHEDVSKIEFFRRKFLVHSNKGNSSKNFSWNPDGARKPKSNISLTEAYKLMEYGKQLLKEK